ncbi:hypothetical protein VTG60DRAFT_1139 [Thermothelomyces hinnuleus]
MNHRSRFVPDPAYSINPYQQQQQQQYGAVPQQPQSQGMMSSQRLSSVPSSVPGGGQTPMQPSMSPSTMWTANFANGPIIEDLCAPPPPIAMFTPPINAIHQPMPLAAMRPGAMPQVQNVYGIRQPALHPFPCGVHPGQGPPMHGMPSSRVVGSYPPYASQQPGIGIVYPPPPQMDLGAMMARPRLDTGFASTIPAAPAPSAAGNAAEMGQMAAPNINNSPAGEGMPSMTPAEEEALREFLSPDLGKP